MPFVLDISPAVAARGKIRLAEKRRETIPEGYALDKDGKTKQIREWVWFLRKCQPFLGLLELLLQVS